METNGKWTKEVVSKLQLTDSTIRESMRKSCFGIVALPRTVADPKDLQIQRQNIPQGTKLAIAMHQIHHDPAFYSDPDRFNAFRFSKFHRSSQYMEKTGIEHSTSNQKDLGMTKDDQVPARNAEDARVLSSTTITDHFLSFGYGRHACPGRFFAVHEMKMLLAMILKKYDIEPLECRPPDRSLVEVKVPFEHTIVRIRRRQGV